MSSLKGSTIPNWSSSDFKKAKFFSELHELDIENYDMRFEVKLKFQGGDRKVN